ncbi:MAG: hypothetical protein HQL50_10295 [Magnetococcales bacterium]|nr:hypothetical protein [Magnetococcales bacterium]
MPAIHPFCIGADALSQVTGKTFTVEALDAGKGFLLTPTSAAQGAKGAAVANTIVLDKTTAIEGLPTAKAAANGGMAAQGATAGTAAKGAAAPAAATMTPPPLVEIEGAGKVIGAGGKTTGTLTTIEANGVLQQGAAGPEVLLQTGEAKLALPAKAKAAAATQGATMKGAAMKGTAIKGATAAKGAGTAKGMAAAGAGAAAEETVVQVATAGAAAPAASAGATAGASAAGGTIWNAGGFKLGLGLGLGAWGPVVLVGTLAAAGFGVYTYMKRSRNNGLEEVIS